MMHLAVHLPREALLAGPVQYRWMYPVERLMGRLKRNVKNKSRPEGSIAEAYIENECSTFCSQYLRGVETVFNRRDRNYDSDGDPEIRGRSLDVFTQRIRLLGAGKGHDIDRTEFKKARWFVLNNCKGISNYLE